MIELVIIADDLTGAIDTGVQLAKQGISTTVAIEPDAHVEQLISTCTAQILVFNTESRHITARDASMRVSDTVKKAKLAGVISYYKKTDSTMRGNIGAELEAFLTETGQQLLPFIPAHPKLKRFTRNGFHYIDRQFLHETTFGHDPLEPIKTSYIPELLHQQTSIPIHLIDNENLRDLHKSTGVLVFNCDSEEGLVQIGESLFTNGLNFAISGSAALAERLPSLLKLKPDITDQLNLRPPSLIVNGSLNNISYQQVKHAGEFGIKIFSIPEELLNAQNIENNEHLNQLISGIQGEMQHGKNAIISSVNMYSPPKNLQTGGMTNNHENISEKIGIIVASILKMIQINTLVVIGGDTLLGVMRAIECKSIIPKSEIFTGVAVSLAEGQSKTIQLVTKPGGYGERDAILNLLSNIKKQNL